GWWSLIPPKYIT
nr:Chain C, Prl-1 (PTP4A1) [synthetic construct]3RZ2_D Chain D, Prl-1 (PTP4A1) [synthetic construct]